MIRPLCLILCILTVGVHAQRKFSGTVVDEGTGLPIPFVNIGVVGGTTGTVSDANGLFQLEFAPGSISTLDILRISSLGYRPYEVRISKLEQQQSGEIVIRLKAEPIALNEVVLSNSTLYQVEEEIGYPDLAGRGIGYWKDSVALGGELASLIRVDKGQRKLNTLFFEVLYNPSDSVKLRINFYKPLSGIGYPNQNLNQSGKNILYTLRGSDNLSVIDLEPYDLWVDEDFIISLELLAVYGTQNVSLSLPAGNMERAASFRRYASQASWERIEGSAMGYYIQSTLFTDNAKRLPKARVVRNREKNQREISGFVFYAGRPLPDARLRNYTLNKTVLTDRMGRYKTRVSKGDLLGISYPGLKTLIVEIEDPKNFNFQMQPE
jgi:hypothetical protein